MDIMKGFWKRRTSRTLDPRFEMEVKRQGTYDSGTQLCAHTRRHRRVIELGGVEELDEINGYEHTAYNFSRRKKWWILTVVALCQTSMNFVRRLFCVFFL